LFFPQWADISLPKVLSYGLTEAEKVKAKNAYELLQCYMGDR
jgi:hypothetical protein